MEGDVVAWTPTRIEDIEIGDVIVFKSHIHWPDEKILVHRVSDIKYTSNGERLLETKGDRNPWVDQAGPHIPEPYIREKNLMGKVISIGQFPLKIPFVGMLGIWINQGLETISQPTSSKDSISYAGIFAPLTISAVILVILIFILPEKAKTVKEKLKLYIIGPRPLNIKKTVISFFIAYVAFFMIIHMFAYESISASVGINAHSNDDVELDFGRIRTDIESFPLDLPVINPSTMPVKGIIFGRSDMSQFIRPKLFQLDKGETNYSRLKAYASNSSLNGTYTGEVVVYSSPFWLIFPDGFIEALYSWSPETTVYILDLLAGIILTSLTMIILLAITFIGDRLSIWLIDKSWRNPSRVILKRSIVKKVSLFKKKAKRTLHKDFGWMLKVEYSKVKEKESFFSSYAKPMLASLVILPILILISDQMTAMIISVLLGAVLAYLISCKQRKKIILTVLITMIIAFTHMMIQSNIIIFEKGATTLEILALSLGAIGIYMLLLTLLLIPLTVIAWLITRAIRNVKERKDPLLSLEGSCDL